MPPTDDVGGSGDEFGPCEPVLYGNDGDGPVGALLYGTPILGVFEERDKLLTLLLENTNKQKIILKSIFGIDIVDTTYP